MGVQMIRYRDFSVPERRCDEANSEIGVWAVRGGSRGSRGSGVKHVVQEPGCQVPDIDEEREVGGGLQYVVTPDLPYTKINAREYRLREHEGWDWDCGERCDQDQ
jgi:hypothetical protein